VRKDRLFRFVYGFNLLSRRLMSSTWQGACGCSGMAEGWLKVGLRMVCPADTNSFPHFSLPLVHPLDGRETLTEVRCWQRSEIVGRHKREDVLLSTDLYSGSPCKGTFYQRSVLDTL